MEDINGTIKRKEIYFYVLQLSLLVLLLYALLVLMEL